MNWFQSFNLAWKNMVRHWRHSLSTLIAIASGFTAISLFDGFTQGIRQQSLDAFSVRFMLGDLIIEKPETQFHLTDGDFKYTLNKEEQTFLEEFFHQDSDFSLRTRFLGVMGLVTNGDTQTVFYGSGYDLIEGAQMRGPVWSWNTLAGKPLQLAPPFSVLLGKNLGWRLGCQLDSPSPALQPEGGYTPEERTFRCPSQRVQISSTTESGQINAIDLEISGIMDVPIRELDDKYVSFSLETAQQLLNTDRILRISVQLKKASQVTAFARRLQQRAQQQGYQFDVIPVMAHQVSKLTRDSLRVISLFRGLFMSIVILVSLLSIANTMMKAVSVRNREIGTLRSLGFLPNEIRGIFGWEGSLLAFNSCWIGWILTILISLIINAMGIRYSAGVLSTPIPLRLYWVPSSWLQIALLLIGLAYFTSWFSARRVTNQIIAENLRQIT